MAIAGRSADKLSTAGLSPEIEIIIADGDDDGALKAMARAKVILSTAGPFHRYGRWWQRVEKSTHYIDITGEISVKR